MTMPFILPQLNDLNLSGVTPQGYPKDQFLGLLKGLFNRLSLRQAKIAFE